MNDLVLIGLVAIIPTLCGGSVWRAHSLLRRCAEENRSCSDTHCTVRFLGFVPFDSESSMHRVFGASLPSMILGVAALAAGLIMLLPHA